jgi:hypothetical protein
VRYTLNMNEKPRVASMIEIPEFDIFSLPDNEVTVHVALQAIHIALQIVNSWGRNGAELKDLHNLAAELQRFPTPENALKAFRYVKGLLADKQDYN